MVKSSVILASLILGGAAAKAETIIPPTATTPPTTPTVVSSGVGSNGIRIGSGRLHPYIQIENHWITNPGRLPSAQNAPNDMATGGRPGLDFDYSADQLKLQLGASIEFRKYWGIENPETKNLSNTSFERMPLTFSGSLAYNPEGVVGVRLSERVTRSVDAANQTVSRLLFHTTSQTGVGVDMRPGGGALTLSVGYGFFYDYYDRANNVDAIGSELGASALDNVRHLPEARLSWKFMPKTSVFVEGRGQITRFNGNNRSENTDIIMGSVGLTSQLSKRISALLRVGYGDTFGRENPVSSTVGQIEGGYQVSEGSKVALGVMRSVEPASIFRYYVANRVYTRIDQQIGNSVDVSIDIAYQYLTFGTPTAINLPGERKDHNIVGGGSVSYQVTDWVALALVDRVDYRNSNFVSNDLSAGYINNDILLQVNARY